MDIMEGNGIECPDEACSNDTWKKAQDEAEHDYACMLCGKGVKVKEEEGRVIVEPC